MYLNKVQIIGNITKDIELKALPSGSKVASFGIATNRVYVVDGQKKEDTQFHNIVVFGKQAETIAQYCKKGDQLYVEGRLQTRSWEAQDGSKRYSTEVVLENFQFGKKSGDKVTRDDETGEVVPDFDKRVEDLSDQDMSQIPF